MSSERERCWTHPDYVEAAARWGRERDDLVVRNGNLAEQLALLRDRTGLPGLQGLIYEMRQTTFAVTSGYWADRLEALVRGDPEAVPRTQDEKVEFRKNWDARVVAAGAGEG